jgi:hypothetical protein
MYIGETARSNRDEIVKDFILRDGNRFRDRMLFLVNWPAPVEGHPRRLAAYWGRGPKSTHSHAGKLSQPSITQLRPQSVCLTLVFYTCFFNPAPERAHRPPVLTELPDPWTMAGSNRASPVHFLYTVF